jgi:fucose permease
MKGYKLLKEMNAETINLQVAYFCGYLNGVVISKLLVKKF